MVCDIRGIHHPESTQVRVVDGQNVVHSGMFVSSLRGCLHVFMCLYAGVVCIPHAHTCVNMFDLGLAFASDNGHWFGPLVAGCIPSLPEGPAHLPDMKLILKYLKVLVVEHVHRRKRGGNGFCWECKRRRRHAC